MFFRSKQSGGRTYVQLVENEWRAGRAQQRVIATVGRLDKLIESGGLESLIRSGARFYKGSAAASPFTSDDPWFSSRQVSKILQISPSTVTGWVNQGQLPAFRTPGGQRRVKLEDLRRFLRENGMPLPPELGARDETKRVFVVDDDPLVIRAIRRTLVRAAPEYHVTGCTDGIAALVLIGAEAPDLVLLDVHMEGIDGFEVCRRLRLMPQLARLKIVAITAFPSDEARARILDYGATDYWVKPVDASQIIDVLGEESRNTMTTTT